MSVCTQYWVFCDSCWGVCVVIMCCVSLCSSAHTRRLFPLRPRHSHPVCTTMSLMFLLCGFLSGQPCLRDHLTLRFCQTLQWLGRCQLPSVRTQCCKTCGLNSRGSDRTTRRWESVGFSAYSDTSGLAFMEQQPIREIKCPNSHQNGSQLFSKTRKSVL